MINLRSVLVAAMAVSAGSFVLAQGRGGGNRPQDMTEGARLQIEALIKEKATRSPGRRKMDSRLIYGIKMRRGEKIAPGVDTLAVELPQTANGQTIVDITAGVDAALLRKLRQAGATILGSYPESHSVRAQIELEALDAIADFPEIRFIQPMQEAMVGQAPAAHGGQPVDPEHLRTTRPGFDERERTLSAEIALAIEEFQANAYNVGIAGVRKSEADLTHRTAAARNTYGFDGTGIKIGVLSDGVRNLAAAQASGDVGPVSVLTRGGVKQDGLAPGFCSATASCDEGTAMLEIVHDIAPGAQLFFASAFGGSSNFASNIRALREAGCDIIVDDVFYFAESPFQDGQAPNVISPTNGGVIMQAVNDVTAGGALYFSSAGNSGNKTDGTSGVWEGDFVDGGDASGLLAGAGRVNMFPGGGTFNVVALAGSSQYNLNWSDPLGGSANDYDLYALNAAGTVVIAASTASQDGTQDPFEAIGPVAAGSRLVIVRFSGADRYLRLTTNRGRLSVSTPGQTTGHSTAANAFGVAATPVSAAFPNPFNTANSVETFSSDGPRKLFFQANGSPFTPGNLLASGGITRQKPDITAADGVSVTGAGGFGIQFFGTSAAAPHAAAIAALLKGANPALTPAQIRHALQSTAIDIESAGVDRDAGNGIVMADLALMSIGAPPNAANVNLGTPTAAEVGGNANGFIEPGERGTILLPLLNAGEAAATNVTATLSSTTPGVMITPSATRSYPDINAIDGSSSAAPFEFVLQEGAAYSVNIEFVLNFTYNGVARTVPFVVPTGQLANISSVLDTVAPAAGAGFGAATGLQTGRMNFSFPISRCGSTKASPGPTSALPRRYDAYTFTNTSAAPICVTALLTHSATALVHLNAYIGSFNPASVAANWLADNGGSTTSGAGTTQMFSFSVPAGQTFVLVVSESNQNGGLGVAYSLRVSGLPASAVPANAAPVNAVPAPQTILEDGTLVFTGANAISVSDADAGNNPVEVTLAGNGGLVSLGSTAGLTFSAGTGSGDTSMTFTGSIAAVNNALNGTSFAPGADFNGPASLTLTTSDQGSTGTGGAQSDTDTITIDVTPVNDAPSFTAGASQAAAEDSGATSVPDWASGISVGAANEAAQTVAFALTNDNNALFSVQPAVAPNGTLTFTPAPDANGLATVTVVLKDSGGTDNGGADTSAPQTFTISVIAVNDAPHFTAGANQSVAEDSGPATVPNWATGPTAGPADESGQALSFVATNDNAALFSAQPAVAPDGTLTFTPAANANGLATVTVRLGDDGGVSLGGVDQSSQTFTITVTAINDAPGFIGGANQTVAENSAPATVPNWATGMSAGPSNESGQALAFIVTNNNGALFSVQPSIAANGTLTFTPRPGANGQAVVTAALQDNGGTAGGGIDTSAVGTFTITITAAVPAGSDVIVTPTVPPGTPPVTITFDEVLASGPMTVGVIDPATAPPPPSGFQIGSEPLYYQISTAVVLAPGTTAEICFSYAGVDFGQDTPRLFHEVGGSWVDITSRVDTASQTLCGTTASFSPFAIFKSPKKFAWAVGFYRPLSPDPSVVNNAKAGSTVPLKFNVFINGQEKTDTTGLSFDVEAVSCTIPARFPKLAAIWEIVGDWIENAAEKNSKLKYDTKSDQFVLNWKTPKIPGCYVVSISYADQQLRSAQFRLR